ncbi:MAG: LytTR family DNA-binding domain-containing protein [Gemmatimonadota bacterium]|nr:LytTR family DNA-binding domain-containing protein [Gemmatimonadota bacterium]
MSIRAVVVDDEPSAREVVRSFAERGGVVEIVAEATNGDEAIERVREHRPDLVFLDVQMPDRDGFGVIEALRDDLPPGIIFVTAHDQYALRAFEVRALDYLLKPFGYTRFHEAVSRAARRLAGEQALDMRRTLRTLVDAQRGRHDQAATLVEAPPMDRIGVRRGTRTILVELDDIDWIEAADDYSRLHVGEDSHLLSARMHDLERRLPDSFFRAHRSTIVRLDRVIELRRDAGGGGVAILRDGVRLRVARGRWEDLERALGLAGEGGVS